jgi:hypothetical protein
MSLLSGLPNTTTSRLKARGLSIRKLTLQERVAIAVALCTGKLDACNFGVVQSAQLLSITPSYVAAGVKADKAAANGGSATVTNTTETVAEQVIDAAVDAFVAVFSRVDPQTREDIVRKLAQL